jgi:hypothetical protein
MERREAPGTSNVGGRRLPALHLDAAAGGTFSPPSGCLCLARTIDEDLPAKFVLYMFYIRNIVNPQTGQRAIDNSEAAFGFLPAQGQQAAPT